MQDSRQIILPAILLYCEKVFIFHSHMFPTKSNTKQSYLRNTSMPHFFQIILIINLNNCISCKLFQLLTCQFFPCFKFYNISLLILFFWLKLNIQSSIPRFSIRRIILLISHNCQHSKDHSMIKILLCSIKTAC